MLKKVPLLLLVLPWWPTCCHSEMCNSLSGHRDLWPDYHRALVKDILRHCIKVAGHFSSDFRDIFFQSVRQRRTGRAAGHDLVEMHWQFLQLFHSGLRLFDCSFLAKQGPSTRHCQILKFNCYSINNHTIVAVCSKMMIIIIIRIYLSPQTGGYTQAIHLTNQIVRSNIHPYTQTPKCITLGHLWSVPTFIHTHEVITNKNETGGKGVTKTDGILKIFWNSLQCRNVRQKEVKCSKAMRRKRCSSGVWDTFSWPLFICE